MSKNKSLTFNLTIREIVEYIYNPMVKDERIEIPQEYKDRGESISFMKFVRRLGEVERFFKRNHSNGYRVKFYNLSGNVPPRGSLYTLMELYKDSVIDLTKHYKREDKRCKTYSDLLFILLDKGYDIRVVGDMLNIEHEIYENDVEEENEENEDN